MTYSRHPMRERECASDDESIANLSVPLNRQFISGSEESPVSKAITCLVMPPKHSSTESKPDLLPKIPKYGVHACAGMSIPSGEASRRYLSTSLEFIPKMGRPSPASLPPWFSRVALNFWAEAKDGISKT